MIFKDREDAGKKLAELLRFQLKSVPASKIVVVSLLRGGVIVGAELARGLNCKHIALPVAKVGSPRNPELAIGAVCFDITYLEKRIIDQFIGLKKNEISAQIGVAQKKFASYLTRFSVDRVAIDNSIAGQYVILVDDGIATGATMKAAALFTSLCSPYKIIIATPVVLNRFEAPGIEVVSYHIAQNAHSISQFYHFFPQLGDKEVIKHLAPSL